jgi:hypothetical protein
MRKKDRFIGVHGDHGQAPVITAYSSRTLLSKNG